MFAIALSLSVLTLAPQEAPKPTAAKTKAVQAQKGSLRATLERKGRLVPTDVAPVRVELDAYTGPLKVVDVLPHGTVVNAGDVVVRFDPEKLDEQIEKAEFDLAQAAKKLEQSEAQAGVAAAAARDALTQADRDLQWARRRLEGYLEHELEFDRESNRLSKQSTAHRLEDQQDELTQLEKMYKEDELVDATEEIVLKRSRRGYASSQQYAKLSERRQKYQWEFTKAMQRERLELDTAMKVKAFERTKTTQELAEQGRQLGLERARFDLDKQKRVMEKLRGDRKKLALRAPRDGILLHGDEDGAPGTKIVKQNSSASAGAVLMTVAAPDRFEVRTDIPETHLYRARTGTAAELVLTALPESKLAGAIRVELLPSAREGDVNLYRTVVPLPETDPRYRPGMGCKVTIVLDQVKDAVLVPLTAVATVDGKKVVRCGKTADGPFEERAVVVGPDDGKQIAIRRGVAAGEFVLVGEAKK